jgi:hypothetical protein
MPPTQPPFPALPGSGRESCVHATGLIATLLALLAALLGRRHRATAWYPIPDPVEDDAPARNPYDLRTHWHADCDPSILYVIGPPPNRGMRAHPRANPTPRPESARAPPPHAPPAHVETPSPGGARPRPNCYDIKTIYRPRAPRPQPPAPAPASPAAASPPRR